MEERKRYPQLERYYQNRDEINARKRAYRKMHKAEVNLKAKVYRATRKEEIRAYNNAYAKRRYNKHMEFREYLKSLPREEQWAARCERDRLEINHWRDEYAELRGALCMILNGGLRVDPRAEIIKILNTHKAAIGPRPLARDINGEGK